MTIVNRIKGFVRSISGVPPITLPDCVDNNSLINYTISGNSVQGGIPTPDTPVEVESVGDYDEATGKYKIPVVCSGKNLFEIRSPVLSGESAYRGYGGTNYTVYDYGYKLMPYTGIGFWFNDLEVGENYTISCRFMNSVTNGVYFFIGQNQGTASTSSTNNRAYSYNIKENARLSMTFVAAEENLISFGFGTSGNITITDIQLEKGDTATDYEPYAEPVTTNIYLDEPLRKIGNYADYINFENQKVVRNTKVLNSFNSMAKYIHNSSWCSWYFGGFQKAQMMNSLSNICKYIVYDVDFTSSSVAAAMGQATNTTNKTYGLLVRIKNDALGVESSDTDAVKLAAGQQYLNDNRAYFVIRITTPNETQVDLSKLPTVKGTTIYTVGTTTQPSYMSATYYSTVKE